MEKIPDVNVNSTEFNRKVKSTLNEMIDHILELERRVRELESAAEGSSGGK
jgi:hypothetical protein